MHYILIGKNPVKVDCLASWALWHGANMALGGLHVDDFYKPAQKPLRKGGKMLAKVNIKRAQKIRVSTVFLGLDHNHSQRGKPVLFETLVFGGAHDGFMLRYTSFDDARETHKGVVKMAVR